MTTGGVNPSVSAAEKDRNLVRRAQEAATRESRRTRISTALWQVGLLIAGLLVWETLSGPVLDPFFFSRPSAIISQLATWIRSGQLAYHLRFTVIEMLSGYVLGAALGVLAALLFGLFYYLYEVSEPVVMMVYSIPTVAIAPLLIIWFGLGMTPKVVLAAFFVFFVVFMNSIAGIRNVNKDFVNIARVMGASQRDIITKIIIPNAYPFILTAMRVTLPTALIGAVVGEFIASNRGVAYLIMAASMRYNTAGTFGALAVLAAVVFLINMLLEPIEAQLMRWRPSTEQSK